MAEQKNLSQRIGLTPAKLVLIGVLAAALVGVLVYQSSRSGDLAEGGADLAVVPRQPVVKSPDERASTEPITPDVVEARLQSEPSGPPSESFDRVAWKSPDVATIIGYDPFALPEAFPRPLVASDLRAAEGEEEATSEAERASQLADTVAEMRSQLEELRQRGVRVIVKQRDEYVAMIGDRTIHVGDEINGFTVTAIEPDGVRVERKVEQ